MKSYDAVIFGSWPKGLYLAEQLSKQGRSVCYVELPFKPLPPIGLFLESEEERVFFESIGVLNKQKEGFSILTPEGNWSFQESSFVKFQKAGEPDNWLDMLSYNLMSPVFEYNNFKSSKSQLNFFSDYYSIALSVRKKKAWKEKSNWDWESVNLKSQLNWSEDSFFINNEQIKAQHIICLNESDSDLFSPALLKNPLPPDWKWSQFNFSGKLGVYNAVVPHHFVYINNLSLPWTHDNLLSVFCNQDSWEIWLRLPARDLSEEEKTEMIHSLTSSMENHFKGTSFKFIKSEIEGFAVYGREKLKHTNQFSSSCPFKQKKSFLFKDEDFFPQVDLAHHLKGEQRMLEKVLAL